MIDSRRPQRVGELLGDPGDRRFAPVVAGGHPGGGLGRRPAGRLPAALVLLVFAATPDCLWVAVRGKPSTSRGGDAAVT